MKSFQLLKLGTQCVDRASGLPGTLTHWIMNMGEKVEYLFQPKGLDEEGQPLKKLFLCEARLEVSDTDFEDVKVPVEILGSEVMNEASGFHGMAVEFVRHLNGCFHVVVQPKGKLEKTGLPFKTHDFDLRELKGEKVRVLTEEQKREEDHSRPSPSAVPERPNYS